MHSEFWQILKGYFSGL